MIKLIVGTKGSGKTKAMIDQINDAVKTSKGNVVVVEKGMSSRTTVACTTGCWTTSPFLFTRASTNSRA